jgi:hypothetical protein
MNTIFYMMRQGGLMRCCTGTLSRIMLTRWEADVSDGEDGEVIGCDHCSSSMIRAGGIWARSQSVESDG